MSTKTTLKRIALVAVSALGLGLMSVVPASARTSTANITLGTPVVANAAVVGQSTLIAAPITLTSLAASDTFTVSATLVAQPTGSSKTTNDITATGTAVANIGDNSTSDLTVTDDNNTIASSEYAMSGSLSGTYVAGSTTQYFSFTPAVAGTYTFAVFLDGASGVSSTGAIKALDTVKYVSFTAVAAPAVTAEITKPLAGSIATYDTTGSANGVVLKVRVKDAAGAYTRLDGSQQVLVNLPSGLTVYSKNGSSSVATTQYGLVAGDFDTTGNAYLNVSTGTAGTYSITAGLAGSTTLSTVSVTFVAPTGVSTAAGSAADNANGVASAYSPNVGVSGAIYTAASTATISKTQTSTTITAFGAAASKVVVFKVSDTTAGRVFGYTGAALYQDLVATTAATAAASTATDGSASKYPASVTISHTALSTSATNGSTATGFTVASQATSNATAPALSVAITGVSPAAGSAYWDTDLPTATYLVVNGGSITISAELYNQYGVALTGTAVTASISAGRNVQATATNLITDASGGVTFTVTDAVPASTTSSDTVTFTYGAVTEDVTINYVAALTATTMTTSPSATTTTALTPGTLGAINTATATASTNRYSVTATLKDAGGVVIVGMPVTLTVPADVSLYSTTPAVAYTDSTGIATWSVYTTKAGTYKFTATGGGLTKDFYGKFTAGSARVVSATAGTTTGDTTPITIKVSDAYGNGVGSEALTVSTDGGYFQGAALSSTISTDANGEIRLLLVGNGKVTATGTATHMFYGAALVGTTAAAGFPAGVNSASVTVSGAGSSASAAAAEAASDAAAEAIDAANAATDAANLAAEAADAATVAAEEARDAADAATAAVEELATQVATLMAALKAQITTLANTVAKIAKKVKA